MPLRGHYRGSGIGAKCEMGADHRSKQQIQISRHNAPNPHHTHFRQSQHSRHSVTNNNEEREPDGRRRIPRSSEASKAPHGDNAMDGPVVSRRRSQSLCRSRSVPRTELHGLHGRKGRDGSRSRSPGGRTSHSGDSGRRRRRSNSHHGPRQQRQPLEIAPCSQGHRSPSKVSNEDIMCSIRARPRAGGQSNTMTMIGSTTAGQSTLASSTLMSSFHSCNNNMAMTATSAITFDSRSRTSSMRDGSCRSGRSGGTGSHCMRSSSGRHRGASGGGGRAGIEGINDSSIASSTSAASIASWSNS